MTVTPQGGPVSSRQSHPAQFVREITPHDTNPNQARALLVITGATAGNIVIRGMNDTADTTIGTLPSSSMFELNISVAFVRATGTNLGTGGKVWGLD